MATPGYAAPRWVVTVMGLASCLGACAGEGFVAPDAPDVPAEAWVDAAGAEVSPPVAACRDKGTPGATAGCLAPTREPGHYVAQGLAYFDTLDVDADPDSAPTYAELVARWEWPPWLKLTAWTRDNIEATDTLLRLYPSIVEERDCRAFGTQPFGRCRVVFRYEDHGNLPCPIYEEFTFNDSGEITWIEAWSDQPDLRPMDPDADPWGRLLRTG